MKLILFSPDTFSSVLLPEKCAGLYWVSSNDTQQKSKKIIAVEGIRTASSGNMGQWILKSNSQYQIVDHNMFLIPSVVLECHALYTIQEISSGQIYRLFTEPLSEDRKSFRVYQINKNHVSLKIGRAPNCDIQFANDKISKLHATLHITDGKFHIIDNNSLNKTFVSGRAISQADLQPGDVIFLMGLQIIVSQNFLYINNPDSQVTVQTNALQEIHLSPYVPQNRVFDEDELPESEEKYYYRSLRFKQDVNMLEINLDPPPTPQSTDSLPLMVSLGPSVTMGMASATTSIYAVYNAISSGNITSAIPSIAMGLGMLAGTLMWPIITKNYQKKDKDRKELARQTAYKDYLSTIEAQIEQETKHQEHILRKNDCDPQKCVMRITSQPMQIWERTSEHSDFLKLRLGLGKLPLFANIHYPERRFSVEPDSLTESMYQFGERERWLNDVPICLSLLERFIWGIYAERSTLTAYAKSLVLQIVTLHSYNEVKLIFLYDQQDEHDFSFARWLPHAMSDDRRIRYIATTYEEVKELSANLEPCIEFRKGLGKDQLEEETPHYVIFCFNKKLATRATFLRTILEQKDYIKFSVVSMYEQLKDLPKECSAVISLEPPSLGTLTILNNICDSPLSFQPDLIPSLDLYPITQILSNTQIDIEDSKFQLPQKYTFLEMLGVGMVEHLNLLENWSLHDPTKTLSTPIGIDQFGEPFMLDLHERFHGPHGLIAGMTGSGKSEAIISYILSMAVNYHPQEVAFILIDYKGGGMAKAFENIPHTAGVITNLDGNSINRSLVSLRSELHRRELIFQKVSKQHNISNIDIYKYQKLFRDGKVTEPLPHLIIISDEFAELKKDQPDFMSALTSTARVGRSLGVHLILATQKPGGVVDDQIRSNSRFRLCLKVQDRGDSMEMIGRPDAATLVDTGRFYLQVGNNELFEMGQSAWAGAPYHPSLKVVKELDDSVAIVNTNGRIIAEVNNNRFAHKKNSRKQLDIITEYISQISDEEQIPRWKMWLDPIPAKIYLDDLVRKYSIKAEDRFILAPVVGEYDDPTHQSQAPLCVPISQDGNVIIYGSSGSGKSMFLETMCYSLLKSHSPAELNLYILDFGSETLRAFSAAPQVGDIILSHESEKIENLIKLLHGKINSRKKLISQYGGSLQQYNSHTKKPEPNIVVVINNYANFSALFEDAAGDLNYLTREGIKYGIFFVLSCTGVNNVRFNMMQNFKCIYCLQFNNTTDYANVLGKIGGLQLEANKGRGMFRLSNDTVLEFQTAYITKDEIPYSFFQSFCQLLSTQFPSNHAANVPVLPEIVSIDFLAPYSLIGDIQHVPIGVEKESLEVDFHDFSSQPIHMVLSPHQEWRAFSESLAVLLSAHHNLDTILLAPTGVAKPIKRTDNLHVYSDLTGCVKAVRDIFQETLIRNNTYKEAVAAGNEIPNFKPLFVVIQSIAQLKSLFASYTTVNAETSDDTPLNRLQIAMEKCSKEYAIFFIVAEDIQALTPFTAEKWYKAQVNGNNGIWIGNGITSQYRLNVSAKPQSFNANLAEHFGFHVKNASATLVKFLQ